MSDDELVELILASLDPVDRRVLLLRSQLDLTQHEVAQLLVRQGHESFDRNRVATIERRLQRHWRRRFPERVAS